MRTCAQNFANAFRRCCGRSSCCDGRRRHNSCGKVIILGSSGIFIGLDDDDVGSSSVWSYLVGFELCSSGNNDNGDGFDSFAAGRGKRWVGRQVKILSWSSRGFWSNG